MKTKKGTARPCEAKLSKRVLRVYFKRDKSADQPNAPEMVSRAGREYLRLSNPKGTLAMYRFKDDRMTRLKKWPKALDRAGRGGSAKTAA